MGIWVSLLAAVILAAPIQKSIPSIELPIPEQYKGDATVVVKQVSLIDVPTYCGTAEEGRIRLGCYDPQKNMIVVINSCHYPEAKTPGTFAHLMCHEKAHKNGWRH